MRPEGFPRRPRLTPGSQDGPHSLSAGFPASGWGCGSWARPPATHCRREHSPSPFCSSPGLSLLLWKVGGDRAAADLLQQAQEALPRPLGHEGGAGLALEEGRGTSTGHRAEGAVSSPETRPDFLIRGAHELLAGRLVSLVPMQVQREWAAQGPPPPRPRRLGQPLGSCTGVELARRGVGGDLDGFGSCPRHLNWLAPPHLRPRCFLGSAPAANRTESRGRGGRPQKQNQQIGTCQESDLQQGAWGHQPSGDEHAVPAACGVLCPCGRRPPRCDLKGIQPLKRETAIQAKEEHRRKQVRASGREAQRPGLPWSSGDTELSRAWPVRMGSPRGP